MFPFIPLDCSIIESGINMKNHTFVLHKIAIYQLTLNL